MNSMMNKTTKTQEVNVKKTAENIAQEIQKELTEEYNIDLTGVNIGELTSMISAHNISRFDDIEYPTMEDILPKLTSRTENQSFSIIDIGALIRQYRLWKKYLPTVEVFYAVKCNPDPIILKTLASLGVGFDVASKGEIAVISELETNREKIIYANPCKGLDHIQFARSQQVSMMTFDNTDELLKIKLFHPDAKLVLRILPDDVDHVKSKMPFGSKFGCPMNDIKNVLSFAKYLELSVIGVSFHVGSCCFDPTAYSDALKRAKIVFDISKELGFEFHLVDIGGGFPGSKQEGDVTFEEMAEEINKELTNSFNDVENLRVIAEPGRFFATSALTIVTSITGKKRIIQEIGPVFDTMQDQPVTVCDNRYNDTRQTHEQEELQPNKRVKLSGNKIFHYYINSSVYGMFNNKMFDKPNIVFKLLNKYSTNTYKSVIFGETCDSMDKIAEGIDLPELACGDYLYCENHGAYTLASASAFNGFTIPKVFYIFTY